MPLKNDGTILRNLENKTLMPGFIDPHSHLTAVAYNLFVIRNPERILYYWAREFSSALPTGQGYSTLPRTIVIRIIDFLLFEYEEYHSFFQSLEVTRHTLLSDKIGFHFFELPKLPSDGGASYESGNQCLLYAYSLVRIS